MVLQSLLLNYKNKWCVKNIYQGCVQIDIGSTTARVNEYNKNCNRHGKLCLFAEVCNRYFKICASGDCKYYKIY